MAETAAAVTTCASAEPFGRGGGAGGTVCAETVAQARLEFEARGCGKCGGIGRIIQFGHVMRGMCFSCSGAGGHYTPRGSKALARFSALCQQVLPVLREDIRPGDLVWYRTRGLGAWVRVSEVHDNGRPSEARIGIGDDVIVKEYPSSLTITVDHPAGRVGIVEGTGHGYTIPRWDAQRVAEIVNEVAAMPGVALHMGEINHLGGER